MESSRARISATLCRACNPSGGRFLSWQTSDVRLMMTFRRSSTRSRNSRRSRTACAGTRAVMWNGSWQTAGPSSFGGSRLGTGGSSSRDPGGPPNAAPDAAKTAARSVRIFRRGEARRAPELCRIRRASRTRVTSSPAMAGRWGRAFQTRPGLTQSTLVRLREARAVEKFREQPRVRV